MNIAQLDAEWGECWLEPGPISLEVETSVKKALGVLPAWTPLLARVPWVVQGILDGVDKRISHMPLELWDLISFVVSQDNACRYCYGATRTVLRILGYSEAAIDRIENDVELDSVTAADRTALNFSRTVSRANPLPGRAALAELRSAGFSDPAIAEIAYVAAFAGFGNRMATMFALRPDQLEKMMDGPIKRLMRPFTARKFRGRHSPPADLPAPNEPPFEELIAELDGSPCAHVVRNNVDEAFRASQVPRRTKFLVFAVIARAVGSDHVTNEARRGLASEGMTRTEIDGAIEHLGSAGLGKVDEQILSLARETVRYRTLALQQRTKELAPHMSADEMVEIAGLMSLANSMARLAVLVAP